MMKTAVPAASVLAVLPVAVRNRLEDLCRSLQQLLGERLSAVLVHGSAVRGGYRPNTSDVDVVIVLTDDAPDKLELIGPALRLARASARIECMILLRDEIPRAADVFPLLYDDIRRCHSLLYGTDAFAELVIHDEHRRLRIEQELRDARIRLRRLIAAEGVDADAAVGPLQKKLHQLRSPLFALLSLQKHGARDDLESVLHGIGRLLKVDATPLLTPARDPRKATLALVALLDAAIRDVDTLDVSAGKDAAQ
jgi:predicted nucleotidyltransferase